MSISAKATCTPPTVVTIIKGSSAPEVASRLVATLKANLGIVLASEISSGGHGFRQRDGHRPLDRRNLHQGSVHLTDQLRRLHTLSRT